jgi:predicted aspartyl protease
MSNKKKTTIANSNRYTSLKRAKDFYKTCIVDAIIYNSEGNYKSDYTYPFLIDTGAAITILNLSFNSFIEMSKLIQIDEMEIQYGAGKVKKLPVYKLRLSIKGNIYDIKAAHDKELTLTSLIGMYGFINDLDTLVVSKDTTQLISSW